MSLFVIGGDKVSQNHIETESETRIPYLILPKSYKDWRDWEAAVSNINDGDILNGIIDSVLGHANLMVKEANEETALLEIHDYINEESYEEEDFYDRHSRYVSMIDTTRRLACVAIIKVTDEKAIAEIARANKDLFVRIAAVNRINDTEVLKEIQKIGNTVNDLYVVRAASDRIESMEALTKDPADEARKKREAIIRKSFDRGALYSTTMSEKDTWFHRLASERLLSIGDDDMFLSLAFGNKDKEIRARAISKMSSGYAAIAFEHISDDWVRKSAIDLRPWG